jgi:NAD(P)H-hydrate epimerase
MAKGGSGDVLTGLIGGLLAQGCSALSAACAGVFLHGLAGDLAREELGARGMTAGDILRHIPEALEMYE